MAPGGRERAEKPRFLTIGRVGSPFGLSGEARIEVVTDFPDRFQAGLEVRLGDDLQRCRIESVRPQDDGLLIRFASLSFEEVASLRGQLIRVPIEEAAPLPADHYYLHDVIGLAVVTNDGRSLGEIADVLFTGANDVYIVEGPLGQVLIPAIESVVQSIDLESGLMTVELIPGLLEGE